jgi:hypothetical protein
MVRSRGVALALAIACTGDGDGDGTAPTDGSNPDGSSDPTVGDAGADDTVAGADPATLGPADAMLVPDNLSTCADGFPVQINPTFPQPFIGGGSASCTLLTYSSLQPTSPGVAVSANIGVGPTTGQMRFVRMRILEEVGSTACCSAEQFGEIFTPQANGLTTVPLDFVMEQGTDIETGIRYADWIGLEILAPDVPLPGVWTQNGGPDIALPSYLWLPSLSSRGPAPTQNLRSEGSYSGFLRSTSASSRRPDRPRIGRPGNLPRCGLSGISDAPPPDVVPRRRAHPRGLWTQRARPRRSPRRRARPRSGHRCGREPPGDGAAVRVRAVVPPHRRGGRSRLARARGDGGRGGARRRGSRGATRGIARGVRSARAADGSVDRGRARADGDADTG